MKKKVLILTNSSGGLYNFRKELISEMEKDCDVLASAPQDKWSENLTELGCEFIETPVDRRGINPIKDLLLFIRYIKLIKNTKPDMVLTYTIKPNLYGGLAARLLKVPYAANITGLGTAFQTKGAIRRMFVAMYKIAMKKCKVVFFENTGNCRTFLDEKIVSEKQACVLNGAGVNLEHYSQSPYAADGPMQFLFIGRIMREKGVNELFDAVKKLHDDGEGCTLNLVGGYEENYIDRIKSGEAEGWLKYHGPQEDVRPFYAAAHALVLPSYHEGMSNVLLEAGASGTPIITSNIHGCMEAVDEGVSGLLCEPKNADSLYETLKKFLALPYEVRRNMAEASHKYVSERFDKNIVVRSTVERLFA